VDAAGAGTGLTGMRLVTGAYLQGLDPMGVPGSLPLPCPSTAAHTIQQSGRNVQSPVCASVQSPDTQGDQGIDTPWVHNSSTGSGLSSLPPTPEGGQPGFIAEARGTSHATTNGPSSASVTSTPASASAPPSQASKAQTKNQSKRPFFKVEKFEGEHEFGHILVDVPPTGRVQAVG